MKRKSIWIGAVAMFVLACATVAALADPAQDVEINRPPQPPPACNCPAIYEPVVCRGSDGSVQAFSNGCVAGCAGFTECARVTTTH